MLQRIIDEDTLYMIADTFKAIEDKHHDNDDKKDHLILGYNNVKIYKTNLQAKADSMAYHSIDSTVYFYNKPIFWNYDSQITAESIRIELNNEAIEKMYIDTDAFISSADKFGNYNQVKGREMIAQFQDNKIDYIDILGNGESLYFALNDSSEVVGMNYIRCSHMRIDMDNESLSKINFFVKPAGVFYPAHKIVEDEKQLFGFEWRINGKPALEEFISRKHIVQKANNERIQRKDMHSKKKLNSR